MSEINIRYVTDEKDVIYYPVTHMDAVEGLDLSEMEDLTEIKTSLENVTNQSNDSSDNIVVLKNQISTLENTISSMVSDTGWVNIELKSGITPNTSGDTPQARLMSINNIYILSIKGTVKGATGNMVLGNIPSSMIFPIKKPVSFAQATTLVSNTANFASFKIRTNGEIYLEGSTINPISNTHWFSIDTTVML